MAKLTSPATEDIRTSETEKCLRVRSFIADQIDKHLRKYCENNMVNSTNLNDVSVESRKIKGEGPTVILFKEDHPNVDSLKTKISSTPNVNLKNTSPINILKKEDNLTEYDYQFFYLVLKRKKISYDPENKNDSDSDSGMGDSGISRNGDSPEVYTEEQTALKKVSTISKDIPKFPKVRQHSKALKKMNISTPRKRKNFTETTKPIWFIPGKNSFHVNVNPLFSSCHPKCYSFQCKPRVSNIKAQND